MKQVKKLEFESEYSEKVQMLFRWGREALMNSYKRPDYKKLGFVKEDISELLKLAMDMRYNVFYSDKACEKEVDRFFYATIYALEILGKLQAIESIAPVLERLNEDRDNEFFTESIPQYFEDMGVDSLDILTQYIKSKKEVPLILFEVFKKILKKHPEAEDEISTFLIDYISVTKSDEEHLAFAIMALTDCTGAKHIDFIREIFSTKEVDFSVGGDIESIEVRLGLRDKRDTPVEGFWAFPEDEYIPHIPRPKIGRNDPCPCGSGKKYKKCCLNK